MSIETAVILAGGSGTGDFPVTTAIEKSMLPVPDGDRLMPVIGLVAENCALAGIKRLIILTTERGQQQQEEFFGHDLNKNLLAQMRLLGKDDKIDEELARRDALDLSIEYVIQPPDDYGTAYSLDLVRGHLKGEKQFMVKSGDDTLYRTDGVSEDAEALQTLQMSDSQFLVMGKTLPRIRAKDVGVLMAAEDPTKLREIREKPPLSQVPEDIETIEANISQYVFSDDIWPYLAAEMAKERTKKGEHLITDPINNALQDGVDVVIHPITAEYFDWGKPMNFIKNIQHIADNPKTTTK